MSRLYIFLFCIPLLLASLTLYGFFGIHSNVKMDAAKEMDNAIIDEFSKPNRFGYYLTDSAPFNLHGLTYCIDIAVKIHGHKFTNKNDITNLYILLYEDVLKRLNELRRFRPFFANFPLTPHDIAFQLRLDDSNGDNLYIPYFMGIGVDNIDKKRERLYFSQRKREEPYSQIVYECPPIDVFEINDLYSFQVARRSCNPKPKIPLFKRLDSFGPSVRKSELVFVKKFCKQHNFHLLLIGDVDEEYKHISRAFSFGLCGFQTIQLDKARVLAATCAKEFLSFLQSNKKCVEFIEKRSKDPYWKDSATTPLPRHQAFRISFWDENVDRVPPGYIAEIRVEGESFRYYTSDEYQRVQLVHEESFDEAMKVLEKG